MKVTLNSWPENTPDYVSHRVLNAYIQDTARITGVHEATVYGARVVNVQKVDSKEKWRVTWTQLSEDEKGGKLREQEDEGVSYNPLHGFFFTGG